jgi:peptide/nickel transport system substrate-binding protein
VGLIRTSSWIALSICVFAMALVSVAIGSSGHSRSTGADAAGAAAAERPFAEFRVIEDSVDYLDPGLSYTIQGWAPMFYVYLSLLGYRQVGGPAGATLVPVLATKMPVVSEDGRTYGLTLRPGLTYSNGIAVKASDFKYTIERLFRINSPGIGFFSNIVGAAKFAKTRRGGISGIVTDDATRRITIHLAKPQGDFANILAMIFAAPVPAGTPAKDASAHPIPSTGPYVISSYTPSRGFTLVRNPHFRPLPHFAATNPDKITVRLIQDGSIALQQTINGQADYDFNTIPVERLGTVQARYGSRLKVYTPANTWYFFLNTRTPPFEKLAVRKAVNYAIDRRALVRLVGGLAKPTENVLPPTYPQFKKHTLYPHNLAKARALVQRAGATGAHVTVWTEANPAFPEFKMSGEYLTDVLGKIGLNATLKALDPNVYFQTIGNQTTKAQIGITSWYQDYPHPLDWFDVLLNGERITPTHNNNNSNANVPGINKTIDRLKRAPTLTPKVNAEWAALDKQVMEQALWAPYINHEQTDFFSSDIDLSCYVNHVLFLFEWGHICKKS